MEMQFEDKDIRMEYKVMKEYVDSSDQPNELFFTKMIYEFHICLDCRHIQWKRQC